MADTSGSYSSSAVLWSSWGMSTVVSTGYAVIGVLTFNSLHRVYTAIPVDHYRRVLEGTMAAALIAPVLVVALNIVSLFVLFYKTWRHSGTGYGYGFVNSSYLHQAFIMLLSSLVLLSDRDFLRELREVGALWSPVDTTLYIVSYYVGFVASGFYVVQFLLLICTQSAVQRRRRKNHQWPEAHQAALLGSEPGTPVPGTPRVNNA